MKLQGIWIVFHNLFADYILIEIVIWYKRVSVEVH